MEPASPVNSRRCRLLALRDTQRRAFIALLGGAAAAWPLAARAQQPAQPAKIGVLYPGLASTLPSRIAAFRDGLQAVGFREPDNVELVLRSTGGDPTRISLLAMELVERKVDVIVAVSAPAVKAARSATTTSPIVAFDLESDPIDSGLINSFSRPGGQVTGVFFDFPEFSKKVVGIAEGGDATAQQRRRFVGPCNRPDANERRRNCRHGIEPQT